MLTMTLAGLRAHRYRLLFAALATLMGTAFVSGTLVLSDTLRTNFDRTVVGNAAEVDLAVVTNNQLEKLPPATLDGISALDGVDQAQGLILGDVTLLGRNGRPSSEQPLGFSVSMRTDFVQGRAPSTDDETVLAQQTAKNTGYAIGDTVTVLDKESGEKHELRVSGLTSVAGDGMLALRGGIGFTRPVAEKMTGQIGFSEIYIKGANPESLRAEVAKVVGEGPYEVFTGQQFAEQQAAGSGIDPAVLRSGLLMFALVALLVAMFVIYNTFSILVAQRTRELALSRCIGASRRQVFAGVLIESAVVGLVAAVVGLILGIGIGYAVLPVMNAFGAGVPMDMFTVTPLTAVLSVFAGLLTTVAAAFLPARKATRVPPIAALRIQQEPRPSSANRARTTVAILFCVVGVFSAVLGLMSNGKQYPLVLVAVGGMLFFLGVVALGPVFIRPLAWIVGLPLGRLLGVPGRLAVANAMRNPRRAATTVLALVVGITLTTGVSVITRSLESSVDVGVGQAIPADYLITPPGTDASIPRSVASDLRTRGEVTSVTQIREAPVTVAGKTAMLSTIEGAVRPAVVKGSLERIGPGQVALRPERAVELGADVGSTLELSVDGRPVTVTVVALVSGNAVPRMYVPPSAFEGFFPGRGDASVLVSFSPALSPEASRAIVDEATAPFPTTKVVATYDAKERLTSTLNQVTLLITGLLALAVIISLVGIANTMTLSVLERSRESAMLRALGLEKGRLRLMLTTEALIFGVIGGLIGVALGVGFGFAAARVINDSIVLSLPYGRVVLIIAGAGLAGVLAALLPVRQATKTSIVESLASQ